MKLMAYWRNEVEFSSFHCKGLICGEQRVARYWRDDFRWLGHFFETHEGNTLRTERAIKKWIEAKATKFIVLNDKQTNLL